MRYEYMIFETYPKDYEYDCDKRKLKGTYFKIKIFITFSKFIIF